MRILVLAPHPFFQVRGSPIDLDNLLRALSMRPDTDVDVLTYPEGEDRSYERVAIDRIAALPFTSDVRPGFSFRKLVCDVALFFKAWSRVRSRRYDVVHAVEETAYMALLFKILYRVPYVYDLDSSIAQQLVESMPALRPLSRLLDSLEGAAVRSALVSAPVCNALRDRCLKLGAREIVTLHDISQLGDPDTPRSGILKSEMSTDRLVLLYAGNLEPYQGIDLLLEAFAIAARRSDAVDLAVIGGIPAHIEKYRRLARASGITDRVRFLGPRPLEELGRYLADADILTAPRITGINTPMKVFSYLHSGRPVLVTDLPTHSQILTRDVAVLAPAEPEPFAEAIMELAGDAGRRDRLGPARRAVVEANHTFDAHLRRVNELYDRVAARVSAPD